MWRDEADPDKSMIERRETKQRGEFSMLLFPPLYLSLSHLIF